MDVSISRLAENIPGGESFVSHIAFHRREGGKYIHVDVPLGADSEGCIKSIKSDIVEFMSCDIKDEPLRLYKINFRGRVIEIHAYRIRFYEIDINDLCDSVLLPVPQSEFDGLLELLHPSLEYLDKVEYNNNHYLTLSVSGREFLIEESVGGYIIDYPNRKGNLVRWSDVSLQARLGAKHTWARFISPCVLRDLGCVDVVDVWFTGYYDESIGREFVSVPYGTYLSFIELYSTVQVDEWYELPVTRGIGNRR